MRSVRVSLGDRSYPVLIAPGNLKEIGRFLKNHGLKPPSQALIVTQNQVAPQARPVLVEALAKEGFESSVFIPASSKNSEASKSQLVFSRLIKRIAAHSGQNKSLFLVAFGGGVIGDLTGFAASVYRRGIPYIQIPTTLTAQVDSSIGGKTGIDLPEGKNLLGAIYQPALVLCDPTLLESLPERHWSDGFAEVVKVGVIKDAGLFGLLEAHGKEGLRRKASLLEKVIERCVKIKARMVAEDEQDKKGVRIFLNFGHTTGHAIEAASGYTHQYTHGEAVAIGMLVACDIAVFLGVLKQKDLTERLEKVLIKFGLPLFFKGLSRDALLKAMGHDKKASLGRNRFVLPVGLGRGVLVNDVPKEVIIRALDKRKRS